GAFGALAERAARRLFGPRAAGQLAAGALAWLALVAASVGFAFLVPAAGAAAAGAVAALAGSDGAEAERARVLGRWFAGVWLVYVSMAPRDLAAHALRVARALRTEGLPGGRRAVSMIVGRDTAELDEAGIVRAAVESVAESSVDGVMAPMFWAFVLGPVGAFAYRAINTMDSMFGHKDERYILFGRVAARSDDAANWPPARLALPFIALAAFVTGGGARAARGAWRTALRDHGKHESPNAAWPEAAFAGALGVELGGPVSYGGERLEKPRLGAGLAPAAPRDIGRAVLLMYAAAFLLAAAGSALAFLLASL
ncbi:MAG: cobalamin biosynthesis protein CobD, partial [Spirochaetaceae bacterium]|nr:cobalamin biosynthesis protein CobD [Spirochaetaceae bacterium]